MEWEFALKVGSDLAKLLLCFSPSFLIQYALYGHWTGNGLSFRFADCLVLSLCYKVKVVSDILVRWGSSMHVKPAHANTRVPSTWQPCRGPCHCLKAEPASCTPCGEPESQVVLGANSTEERWWAVGQQDILEGRGDLKWSFWHWKELLCVMSWGLKKENCSLGMKRFITVCLASLQLEKEDAH